MMLSTCSFAHHGVALNESVGLARQYVRHSFISLLILETIYGVHSHSEGTESIDVSFRHIQNGQACMQPSKERLIRDSNIISLFSFSRIETDLFKNWIS